VAVPSLLSFLAIGSGLPAVLATGMCPAAPPDIPAYACSAPDYLLRMAFGPWAMAGHIFIWCVSGVLVTLGWLAVRVLGRPRGSTTPPPAAWAAEESRRNE